MSNLYTQQPRTIAIIGGGPAGAATALSLQQSLAATLAVQPQRYQVHLFNMARNCDDLVEGRSLTRVGESIPPAATPILKRLGIEDIVKQSHSHLVCPGSISLWNSNKPEHNDFMLDLDGLGYHLDRVKFDAQLLARTVQSGVELHQGWRLAGMNEVAGRKQLDFTVEGAVASIAADFVVDASGKGSVFTRGMNVCRNVFDDVTFLSAFVTIPEGENILPHTFVEAVEQGWWYAARLPNNTMIITLCTDRQSIKQDSWNKSKQWLSLLKQTTWLRKNVPASLFNASEPTISIGVHSAPSALLSAVCGADWLAVGDAASSYDPITSAGITKALMHGELAGAAIAHLLTKQSSSAVLNYQQHVFADFNRYVSLRNQLYRSENRFTNSGFWRRRLGK